MQNNWLKQISFVCSMTSQVTFTYYLLLQSCELLANDFISTCNITVYRKKSFLSTESDTMILQSIYFAYKVGIISSYSNSRIGVPIHRSENPSCYFVQVALSNPCFVQPRLLISIWKPKLLLCL